MSHPDERCSSALRRPRRSAASSWSAWPARAASSASRLARARRSCVALADRLGVPGAQVHLIWKRIEPVTTDEDVPEAEQPPESPKSDPVPENPDADGGDDEVLP